MKVAIVAANTFEFDNRLRRTATALVGDGHEVVLVGFAGPGLAPREELPGGVTLHRVAVDRTIASAFRPLPRRLRRATCRLLGIDPDATGLAPGRPRGADRLRAPLRRLAEIAAHARRVGPWTRAVLAVDPDADVYHCKALIALPVVRAAAGRAGARFVYDVADIHTEAARLARMPGWFRAVVRDRERRWMRGAAGITAVSDGVADEVVRRFGVARPTVVLNCPSAWRPGDPLPEPSGRLRALAGLPDERRIVLYHGGFSLDRGIEELVAAMDAPGLSGRDVTAVFVGYGRLRDWLGRRAAEQPGRIVVLDAVAPGELLDLVVDADVGYVGQPPRTLNQRLNLPNKLFECLQAGVPVVAPEANATCALVRELGVGRCVDIDRPAALAEAIATLAWAPDVDRRALRARVRAAAGPFSWETQQQGLVTLYRGLAAG